MSHTSHATLQPIAFSYLFCDRNQSLKLDDGEFYYFKRYHDSTSAAGIMIMLNANTDLLYCCSIRLQYGNTSRIVDHHFHLSRQVSAQNSSQNKN